MADDEPRWSFEKLGMTYRCWNDTIQTEFRLSHVKRSRDSLSGILKVSTNLKGVKTVKGVLHAANFNVLSTSTRTALANALDKRTPGFDLDWFDGLEWLCQHVIIGEEQGENIDEVGMDAPTPPNDRWCVEPLIMKGRPALLFGPGGVGKSLIALTCGLSVAYGREIIPGVPPAVHGPVLYLDWETTKDVINDRIQNIAAGHHFIPTSQSIYYRHCVRPLATDAEELSAIVAAKGIVLVIVDSSAYAMGAQGEYGDANESILRMHEALRIIGVTSLIVDHVNKTDAKAKGGAATPYGCYRADTEVLTKSGWKDHPHLKDNEEVLAFDPQSSQLRWEIPSAFHEYDFTGHLTEWSTKATNAIVTSNHRMLVKPGWPSGRQQGWDFVEAQHITTADWLLAASGKPTEDEGDWDLAVTDDWASFYGWFIAEGSAIHSSLRMEVTKPLASKIRLVLSRLFPDVWEKTYDRSTATAPRKPITHFVVNGQPGLVDFLRMNGVSAGTKRVPDEVFDWDFDHRQIFLDALIEGDGHQYSDGAWVLTSKSKLLADDVQRLAIMNGLHADVRDRHTTYKHEPYIYYQVQITDRASTWFRPDRSTRAIPYEGSVYCLTVPSGAYVTRLDGRMAIHGNSAYKTNAARVSWEVRKEPSAEGLRISLYHAKSNDTALLPPIGISLDWAPDAITFHKAEVVVEEEVPVGGETLVQAILEMCEDVTDIDVLIRNFATEKRPAGTIRQTVSRLFKRGDLTSPSRGKYLTVTKGVKLRALPGASPGMFDA